jgi:hypothetical protein
MSLSEDRLAELSELLGALRDGALTDEQIRRLDHLLAAEAEARRFYIDYLDLCSALRHYQGSADRRAAGAGGGRAIAPVPPRRRAVWPRLAVAAALLLAVALAAFRLWRRDGAPPGPAHPGEGQPEGAGPLALLTRVLGAEWEQPAPPPAVGAALPAGRLRLTAGLAQLDLGGATVVLEGPADLELLDAGRAFCHGGRLWARVPPSAHGFTVGTPTVTVVDRGTEFGLSVQEGGEAEVHVFEGKVELSAPGAAPGPRQQLTGGRAARIDPGGRARPTDPRPEEFVGAVELGRRAAEGTQRRHRAWLAASRELRADRRVVLYYPFDEQPRGGRTLHNQAFGRRGGLDASVVGCRWAEGRWPGKAALAFERPGDRARFRLPGKFQSLTLLAWVRVDALDRRFHALMLTDGFAVGAAHWQVLQSGRVRLGVRHALPPPGRHDYDSERVFSADRLGRWTQLVTVYDGAAGTVAHYVNGRPAGRAPLRKKDRLVIGDAEIGNWGRPVSGAPTTDRLFKGRIDEFALFDQPLEAQDVQRLYEAGKPGPD